MRRSSKLKEEKELKRRYGKLAESMSEYYHHLDLRPFDDLDDDAFAFIMAKVKGVNMLDLNETDITNESIRLLTKLEYVKELRIKDCPHLDNGCVEYLNELTELELLHVRYTAITIDGILQLTRLTKLKELMFTATDTESIEEKMLQLKALFPDCRFVINARPYEFS